jgi:uncharacterized protein with PQ loop repeat
VSRCHSRAVHLLRPQMRRKVNDSRSGTMAAVSTSDTKLRGLLWGMSVFTMIMTVPQVLAIWVGHQAAGVSILSWSGYFASALLWLWFGIRQHDRNIYLPCLDWIALDGAVIAGAVVYGIAALEGFQLPARGAQPACPSPSKGGCNAGASMEPSTGLQAGMWARSVTPRRCEPIAREPRGIVGSKENRDSRDIVHLPDAT